MDWSAWESRRAGILLAGQPPIHPRIVAGAILYGLTLSIRSSRKLEDACRKPKQALADSGFHNGTNLSGLEDRGVEALIPARQEFGNNPAIRSDATVAVEEAKRLELPINPQSKLLDKAAFIYQEANDTYYCPMGKSLSFSETRPYQRDNSKGIYRVYQCSSCQGCPLTAQCLRKDQRERRIYRDEYDAVTAHRHSVRTLVIPRSRNWRSFITFLIIPKGDSATAMRRR